MPDKADTPGGEEEVRRVGELFRQLQALLEAVVAHPDNIIPGRHHDAMRQAWDEVRPQFEKIRVSGNHRGDLVSVGLSGSTLVFELAVFAHARDQLLDHAPEIFARKEPGQPPQKPASWWARLRRLFRGSLRAGDIVLGSLGKIPVFGLPAEAIKQYKEGVEECVAISDELVET